MPQSSEDMRDLMGLMFGDRISEHGPEQFLISRGYKLNEDWTWLLPKPDHFIQVKEELCILFLMQEWDYGGVAQGEGERTVVIG